MGGLLAANSTVVATEPHGSGEIAKQARATSDQDRRPWYETLGRDNRGFFTSPTVRLGLRALGSGALRGQFCARSIPENLRVIKKGC